MIQVVRCAPRMIASIWNLRQAVHSVSPMRRCCGNASKASDAIWQMRRSRSTSAGDFTMRASWSTREPSTMRTGSTISRRRRKSWTGMLSQDSMPSSAPTVPAGPAKAESASATSETPSSSGHGATQSRMSLSHVLRCMPNT